MHGESQYAIKRRYERVDVNLQVGFIHQLNYRLTHATQISEGGMLIFAEGDFTEHTPVQLGFILPTDGKLLFIDGEIAYAFKTNTGFQFVGVRFINLPSQIQRQIKYFIDHPE
jgi:c-di-GMP-binding flagellar brake protein YcgR